MTPINNLSRRGISHFCSLLPAGTDHTKPRPQNHHLSKESYREFPQLMIFLSLDQGIPATIQSGDSGHCPDGIMSTFDIYCDRDGADGR